VTTRDPRPCRITAGLGDMLRDARLDARMTQRQVAAYTGVHPSTVSRWESGRLPDAEELFRLLELYEAPQVLDTLARRMAPNPNPPRTLARAEVSRLVALGAWPMEVA